MTAPVRSSHRGARRTLVLLAGLTAVILSGCIGPPAETVDAAGGEPSGAGAESALEHDVRTTFDDDFSGRPSRSSRTARWRRCSRGPTRTRCSRSARSRWCSSASCSRSRSSGARWRSTTRSGLPPARRRARGLRHAPVCSRRTRAACPPSRRIPRGWPRRRPRSSCGTTPWASTLEEIARARPPRDVTPSGRRRLQHPRGRAARPCARRGRRNRLRDAAPDRVFEPLGMDDAVLVQSPEQVPAEHAGGFTTIGSPSTPGPAAASPRPAPCTRRSTTSSPSLRR